MNPERGSASLSVEVAGITPLWFGPDDPVRAASAVARLGDGWLIGQDDANHAAWWRSGGVTRVRLFPRSHLGDVFGSEPETKRLKPDIEAACAIEVGGSPGVLLLGSGASAARTRIAAVIDRAEGDHLEVVTADPVDLYAAVAETLGLASGELNLEGACVVGDRLRWFQRGQGRAGLASRSVDLELTALVDVVLGDRDPRTVHPVDPRRHDLGSVDGLALTITDAVALPDGTVLVSAAAEDTPDAIADGPVAGSVLARLDPDVVAVTPLDHAGRQHTRGPWKLEGLALVEAGDDRARLLGVVDQDDPTVPSLALDLHVRW